MTEVDISPEAVARLREAGEKLASDLFYQIETKHGPKVASEYPSRIEWKAAVQETAMSDDLIPRGDAPKRIWLGAANDDNEREFWVDHDEGGTEYVRADLVALLVEALREIAEDGCNLWEVGLARAALAKWEAR